MNCGKGFLHSFGVWWVLVYRSFEDPRGACHWGRIFAPQTHMRLALSRASVSSGAHSSSYWTHRRHRGRLKGQERVRGCATHLGWLARPGGSGNGVDNYRAVAGGRDIEAAAAAAKPSREKEKSGRL
jgi:hypothetical protein